MGSNRITGGILPGHHAIDDIPKTVTKAGTSIVRTRNVSNATPINKTKPYYKNDGGEEEYK